MRTVVNAILKLSKTLSFKTPMEKKIGKRIERGGEF